MIIHHTSRPYGSVANERGSRRSGGAPRRVTSVKGLPKHIEVHHRSDIGRTATKFFRDGELCRAERSERTLAEAMGHAANLRETGYPVVLFVNGEMIEVH